MRATIRDRQTLSAIRPLELVSYLRSRGWSKGDENAGKWASWQLKNKADEEFEIVVPLSSTIRDFALRMGDALTALEAVEKRSQLEILRDLLLASADLVRIRLDDKELADGSVPVEEGALLFQQAKDMILAAACSTVSPRAYFPSKRPGAATDYLRKVRFGQTERGSFTLTLFSRVPPSLTSKSGQFFEMEEPFERRVTQTLATGLYEIVFAAEKAIATGDAQSFVEGIRNGVSANLCDSVVGLATHPEGTRSLEVSFGWSLSRPLLHGISIPNRIVLPSDLFPVIDEAAAHLKESAPREEFEATGPVVKLERPEGAQVGKVTIHCFVDGQPRKVSLELSDPKYVDAVTAHREGKLVRCSGRLVREGRAFFLTEPFDFAVLSESE